MRITVNGNEINVDNQVTVQNLLHQLGYQDPFVAVAINRTCVPRSQFEKHQIHSQDHVEILAPMSGG